MKKVIKNRIFLIIVLCIISCGIGVYAAVTYKASDVLYISTDGTSMTVNDALNELYNNMNIGGCESKVATPTLGAGMIPVTISDDGTVTYADTNSNWYNYCDRKWANAVILSSGSYRVGDTIPESSIQSYFVWIPRYRYKLWNTGTASKTKHLIEIEFETKDTTPSTGSNNGEWLTHPAFTSFNSNGFWVGKFETGYNGATSTSAAQVNSSDTSKVIIKPNVYSWRYITVGNIFLTSYNYKRDLDSHMMKNTEWGAVAYLSHSQFGIGTEVNINNSDSRKTGYSALPSTDQLTFPGITGDGDNYNQPYNTEIGYLASTTGNITGVYDMSGGTWEYVAGYISGKTGSSGLTPTNYDLKYFDIYKSDSEMESWSNRILGDATGEIGPCKFYLDGDSNGRYHNGWYADYANFASSNSNLIWFYRGGSNSNGLLAGQFAFAVNTGETKSWVGFRIVLTPQ